MMKRTPYSRAAVKTVSKPEPGFLESIPRAPQLVSSSETSVSTRQIGPAPEPVVDPESFRPWANVYGQRDAVNYLGQENVSVTDLTRYSGTDRQLVKDAILGLPEGSSVDLSFNKEHRELVALYGGGAVADGNVVTYGTVSQKALLFDKTQPVDVSTGLFEGIPTTNGTGGNLVGTAYSGLQWMAAKEGRVTGNIGGSAGSFIYRLAASASVWTGVEVVDVSDTPISYTDYTVKNTDIKYLNYRWIGLRSVSLKAPTGQSALTVSLTATTTVESLVNSLNPLVGTNLNNLVAQAFYKSGVLYSPCKNTDSLTMIYMPETVLLPQIPADFYQQLIPYEVDPYTYTVDNVSVIPLDAQFIKTDGCGGEDLAITGMISVSGTSTRGTTTTANVVFERAFIILVRNFDLTTAASWNLFYPQFADDQYQTASAYPASNSVTQVARGAIQGGIQGWRVNNDVGFLDLVPTRARVISSSGVNNALLLEASVVSDLAETSVTIPVDQDLFAAGTSQGVGTITNGQYSGTLSIGGTSYLISDVPITGQVSGDVTLNGSIIINNTVPRVVSFEGNATPDNALPAFPEQPVSLQSILNYAITEVSQTILSFTSGVSTGNNLTVTTQVGGTRTWNFVNVTVTGPPGFTGTASIASITPGSGSLTSGATTPATISLGGNLSGGSTGTFTISNSGSLVSYSPAIDITASTYITVNGASVLTDDFNVFNVNVISQNPGMTTIPADGTYPVLIDGSMQVVTGGFLRLVGTISSDQPAPQPVLVSMNLTNIFDGSVIVTVVDADVNTAGNGDAAGSYDLTVVSNNGVAFTFTGVNFSNGTSSATGNVDNPVFTGSIRNGILTGDITGTIPITVSAGPLSLPFKHIALISPIIFPSESEFSTVPTTDTALLHHSMVLGDNYADITIEAPTSSEDVEPYHLNILRGPLALHVTYVYNATDAEYVPEITLPITFGTQSLNPTIDTYHKATAAWSGNDWTFTFRTLPSSYTITTTAGDTVVFERPRFFSATVMDLPRSDYRGLYVDTPAYNPQALANLNRQIAVSTTAYDKSSTYNSGKAIRSGGVSPQYLGTFGTGAQSPTNDSTLVITGGSTYVIDEKEGNSTVGTTYITRQSEDSTFGPVVQPLTVVAPSVKNVYNLRLPDLVPSMSEVTVGTSTSPFYSVVSTIRANVEGTYIRNCNTSNGVFPATTGIVSQVGLDETRFANRYLYSGVNDVQESAMTNNHACAFCISTTETPDCNNLFITESRYVVARSRTVGQASDVSPIVFTPPISSSVSTVQWDGVTWLGNTEWSYIPTTNPPSTVADAIPISAPAAIYDVAAVNTGLDTDGSLKCFYIAVGTPVAPPGGCITYSMWVSSGVDKYGVMRWYAPNVVTCGRSLYRVKVVSSDQSQATSGLKIVATGDQGLVAVFGSQPYSSLPVIDLDYLVMASRWSTACLASISTELAGLPIYDFSARPPVPAWRLNYGDQCITSPLYDLPVFTFMFGTPVQLRTGTDMTTTKLLNGYFEGVNAVQCKWKFTNIYDLTGVCGIDNNCIQPGTPYLYTASNYENVVYVAGPKLYEMVATLNSLLPPSLIGYAASENNSQSTPLVSPNREGEVIVRLDGYNDYIFALLRSATGSRIVYSGAVTAPLAQWYELASYPYILTDMCINLGDCCDPRDEETVLCGLTSTTITLPQFLCPDEQVEWNIIYRLVAPPPEIPVCVCTIGPAGDIDNASCIISGINPIISQFGTRARQSRTKPTRATLKSIIDHDYSSERQQIKGFAIGLRNTDRVSALTTPALGLKTRGCSSCSKKSRVIK